MLSSLSVDSDTPFIGLYTRMKLKIMIEMDGILSDGNCLCEDRRRQTPHYKNGVDHNCWFELNIETSAVRKIKCS